MKIKEYKIVSKNSFAALELVKEHAYSGKCMTNDDTVKMLNEVFGLNKLEVEYIYIIARDKKGKILGVYNLGRGIKEECSFHLKDLFTFLFLIRANGFEFAHNHIYDLWWEPSFHDVKLVKELLKHEKSFDIKFLENYVICKDQYSAELDTARTNKVVFRDLINETREVCYVMDKCVEVLSDFITNNDEIFERIKYDEQIEISVCGAVAYISEDEKRKVDLFVRAFG